MVGGLAFCIYSPPQIQGVKSAELGIALAYSAKIIGEFCGTFPFDFEIEIWSNGKNMRSLRMGMLRHFVALLRALRKVIFTTNCSIAAFEACILAHYLHSLCNP